MPPAHVTPQNNLKHQYVEQKTTVQNCKHVLQKICNQIANKWSKTWNSIPLTLNYNKFQ